MRYLVLLLFIIYCDKVGGVTTFISLTFDDCWSSQMKMVKIMDQYGMKGTWYLNSNRIDKGTFLTKMNIQTLYDSGHEIGGHTLDHIRLPNVTEKDQEYQICVDRAILYNNGWKPVSFAYPFGDSVNTTQTLVEKCGYNSGRITGFIETPTSCNGCDSAESVPPKLFFKVRSVSIQNPQNIDFMKSLVVNAESENAQNNVGRWLVLNFHKVCDSIGDVECDTISIPKPIVEEFLKWLNERRERQTLVVLVKTVIGGDLKDIPDEYSHIIGDEKALDRMKIIIGMSCFGALTILVLYFSISSCCNRRGVEKKENVWKI